MFSYILQRVILALITIWAISVIAFIIIQLPPGDYVTAYIAATQASGDSVSNDLAESLRQQYALDRPIHEQYFRWMQQVLRGNFGVSFEWRRPVTEVIGDRLGFTVIVALSAIIFTWALALPIGIYSAVRKYSFGDYLFTFIGFIGLAIPDFLLALLLLYLSFRYWGGDVGGLFSPQFENAPWSVAKVVDLLQHLWLPALVLGLSGTASLIRIMRANLLDELRKPYVITARAKGIPERRVILKYPVRVALNPFASTIGYILPQIVGGSVIVSLVVSLPTLGPILVRSLISQDMFLAGTIVLLLGILTVIGTLISDILLMLIDPRIRLERS
jgi:peptide/nickel transport system permease protein